MKGQERRRAGVVAAVVLVLGASLALAGLAGAAPRPLVIGGIRPQAPAVSGQRVVWADDADGNYDIFLHDSGTGVTRRLTTDGAEQVQPAISGDFVVWTDYRRGQADVHGYDLRTNTENILGTTFGDNADQQNASISGNWVAWEDYGFNYNPSVYACAWGGVPFKVGGGYGFPAKRPKVGGDLLVWEDYPGYTTGRTDPDVKLYRFSTGEVLAVAGSARPEFAPATDGRYVVWAESNGTDLDVRAYDTVSGRYYTIGGGPGEQTLPAVGAGVAYWLDNSPGKRLHVDTYDFGSGRSGRFNDYGNSDVSGFAASGGATGKSVV